MKTFIHIALAAFLLFVSRIGSAQSVPLCGTDQYELELIAADPSLVQKKIEDEDKIRKAQQILENTANKTTAVPRIVPVVVHVMHAYGTENISLAQIHDGIAQLNEDFRKLNADTSQIRPIFKPHATDANFEFRLAKIDPQGNCTDGVTRTYTTTTFNGSNDTKLLSNWPQNKYFNIWIVRSITSASGTSLAGYAQFPSSGINSTYGIIDIHTSFGRIGTSTFGYNHTTAHEVGHCFNLYHTFQGGCGSNCTTTGDRVCDTPPTSSNTQNCNQNQNTCSNDATGGSTSNPNPYAGNTLDQVENIMSYSTCRSMFTHGQKGRMDATFATYSALQNLISASNHIATGVNDGYVASICNPIPDFIALDTLGCTGTSIQFSNNTYNVPIDSPSYTWVFDGGTPAVSSAKNPTVVYNSPGVFDVKLIATTSGGTDSLIKSDHITIHPGVSSNFAPYFEGAEDPGFPENLSPMDRWEVQKPDGSNREWTRSTAGPATGVASAYINGLVMPGGEVHSLISPPINFSNATDPIMRFKRAYVQRSNVNDVLKIYISVNCGKTWMLRYSRSGASLQSVPPGTPVSSNFVPTPSQYMPDSLNIAGMVNSTSGRIKIEFTAGGTLGGQDLFIDDINIGGLILGIDGFEEAKQSLNIYPNPFTNQLNISYELQQPSQVAIEIIDMLGRPLEQISRKETAGRQTLQLDTKQLGLAPGVYFVRLKIGEGVLVRKVVLSN